MIYFRFSKANAAKLFEKCVFYLIFWGEIINRFSTFFGHFRPFWPKNFRYRKSGKNGTFHARHRRPVWPFFRKFYKKRHFLAIFGDFLRFSRKSAKIGHFFFNQIAFRRAKKCTFWCFWTFRNFVRRGF